ncbi:SGNH/GDSL hydrolase family protein, partial [Isoptericola nanjingensis]|uniref:SGNH/GDSL hydrolase family protein n=1 Tax=Isoptericola nanjingensis TaxID=903413 RepID=UPI003D23A689
MKLIDYVNAVKLIGKMYGLPVCDLYSNSGITELTLSTYTIDGFHPNADGYKRIGEVLAETLTTGGNNDAA